MIIITGDDTPFFVNLTKRGKPFEISNSAEIKVVLTSIDRTIILIPETIIDKSTSGTDLLFSKIVVKFSEIETGAIDFTQFRNAYLEVQVADPNKTTWSYEISVRKGSIL